MRIFIMTREGSFFPWALQQHPYKFLKLIQLGGDICERRIRAHISHGTNGGEKERSLAVIYDNAIKVESE